MRRILATVAVMTCTLAGAVRLRGRRRLRGKRRRDEGHQGPVRRRQGDAERRAHRGRDRPAGRVRRGRRRARRDPHPLRARARARLRRGRGGVPRRSSSTSPAWSWSSRTTSSRSSSSSKCARLPWTTSSRPTGSGASRTSRSRSSSPSRARWPRSSSRSRCSRSPGARPASTPPPAAGPAPGWLNRIVTSTGFRLLLRVFGFVVFLFTAVAAVFGKDMITNPVFGIFYVLLWVVVPLSSVLLGPVWKAISPVRSINWLFAKLSGSDPDQGLFEYPARLGYWPAAHRPLRVRVARAGLRELHRPRLGAALVRGLRRADADRRRAVRQHLLRAGRPVRGLLQPGRQAVGLEHARRPAARAQPARQPRLRGGPARAGRRRRGSCSAARRTTRSGSRRPGSQVRAGRPTSRATC